MAKKIDSRIPEGPVAEKWTNYKAHQRLVNPKNKLKLDVIVVGTGLAGASAASSLAEMGFNVYNFCIKLDSSDAMKAAAGKVLEEGWLPRHSEKYREAYAPAYRVMYKDFRKFRKE